MTITRPASELQRNIGEIYDVCHRTCEPVYITRNGMADLVVMDAAAFDRQMDLQRRVYDREMRLREAIEEGYRQVEAGQCAPWEDVREGLGQ